MLRHFYLLEEIFSELSFLNTRKSAKSEQMLPTIYAVVIACPNVCFKPSPTIRATEESNNKEMTYLWMISPPFLSVSYFRNAFFERNL